MTMATEIKIFPLCGNKKDVRLYARLIAEQNPDHINAYVRAFDRNENVIWEIVPGDNGKQESVDFSMVKRVEVGNHTDSEHRIERTYITTKKSLTRYLDRRASKENSITIQ